MRIERLAGNRIKVTLTTADLTNLDINIRQLTPDSNELHTFLFHIMETVREETDFNPYSGQVVVEATPSKEGISIIISKLGEEKSRITREQFRKISAVRPKIKNNHIPSKLYYFDDFENLCNALVRLEDEALINSKLYRLGKDYCFMLKNNKRFERSGYILSEFASGKSGYPMQAEHIMEHWTIIAAGEKLKNMAEGIINLIRD